VVQQWSCPAPQSNAQWQLTREGGDRYRITNVNAGLALDVVNAAPDEGAALQLWESSRRARNQQFDLVRVGDGNYQLVARHSGLCVAVDGGSKENGAAILQQACDSGNAAQSFALKVQAG
jgi:hypothetical protein